MTEAAVRTDGAVAPLRTADAPALARLIGRQRPDYMRAFFPFAFDAEALRARLGAAERDRYWALRRQGELAGFFMLRGFDEGYDRPSFGVFVAEAHAGRGLATLALAHALTWCREAGVGEVMLKVDPAHAAAVEVYRRAGFVAAGRCADTGHDILVRKETA